MPESLPDSLWSVHLQSFCRVHVYTCILWFSQGILLLYRVHVYMYILWFCRVFIFLPGTRLNVYFAVLQGTSLRVYCSFAGHVYRSIVLQGIKIRFAGLHVYFVILRGHTIVYVYILSCCRVHIYIVFLFVCGVHVYRCSVVLQGTFAYIVVLLGTRLPVYSVVLQGSFTRVIECIVYTFRAMTPLPFLSGPFRLGASFMAPII